MCGIAGWVDVAADLTAPGHRRLAIIDLCQPKIVA
jgi:asparagine synthetase B (glutamine-hydrolysing)